MGRSWRLKGASLDRAEKQMVEKTLSGCEHGCQINSILCKHPYIILSLFNEAEDEDIDDDEAQINVYKLEWDEEDVSATLVKSINFPETDDEFIAYDWDRLVCNTYFFALIKESKMGGSLIYPSNGNTCSTRTSLGMRPSSGKSIWSQLTLPLSG